MTFPLVITASTACFLIGDQFDDAGKNSTPRSTSETLYDLAGKLNHVACGVFMTYAAFLAAGVTFPLLSFAALGIPVVALACKELVKKADITALTNTADALYHLTASMGQIAAVASSIALAILVNPAFGIITGILTLYLGGKLFPYIKAPPPFLLT